MKSKMPEIVALILVVLALLIPPWTVYVGPVGAHSLYQNEWALIFVGPYSGITEEIDVLLLVVELVAIAGIYFLLKLIVKPPRT